MRERCAAGRVRAHGERVREGIEILRQNKIEGLKVLEGSAEARKVPDLRME